MNTDAELLRRYLADRSQAAFTTLVERHLRLVYFAALRQVGGDTHRAEEVAQSVFTDLARKAAALATRDTLTGWLYTSTRFASAKARRADTTRRNIEQEVETMNALHPEPAVDWTRLRPLIDDAVHELGEPDREAVLLRFFQDRPFAEIGAVLHVSEDAARMRVERALEKLRAGLARRGIESTTAALAAAFANQAAAAVPLGLAGAIAAAAVAGAASGSAAAGGVAFLMSAKSTLIAAAVALAAIGTTFYHWTQAQRAQIDLAAATLERDTLRTQLATERQNAQQSAQAIASLRAEVTALKAKPAAPVLRPVTAAPQVPPQDQLVRGSQKKAVLNNLRQIAAAVDQFNLENRRPPASLDELVGETKYIRRLIPVAGENYAGISLAPGGTLTAMFPDGDAVSYTPGAPPPPPTAEELRARQLVNALRPSISRAVQAYQAANNGAKPTTSEALIPFFATPQEGADFVEAMEAQKAAAAAAAAGGGR